MDQAVQQFVERMALACEKEGMPRIGGRILAFLMATGGTHPLDELAEALQASKASVSTNARMLEQFGMIERVGILGDRRDFYRAQDDPWEQLLRGAQARWRDMIGVFGDAAERLPDPAGRARAAAAAGFHQLLLRESEALLERWHALRSGEQRTGEAA